MYPTLRRAFQSSTLTSKPRLGFSHVRVSDQEREATRLSCQNIQHGLEQFHQNGFVILENAVASKSVEHIHQRMLQDFAKCPESRSVRWNQGPNSGNISQPLPTLLNYLHEDVWANRLGVDIMKNIIGPTPQLSFATSNIALPRSKGRQAVHSDYYCKHFDFPVFLEVNIFLHDVDAHNGATEFWLGTHNGYSKEDHSSPTTGWIKKDVFTPRAKISPPIQPAISKGSLMIRDLRCWHAGRENAAAEPRIVLGFMYSPLWFGSHMRMTFPRSARPRLEAWMHIDCLDNAEFVPDETEYLTCHQDINLTQTPLNPDAPYRRVNGAAEVTHRDYWTPP